MLLIKTKVDKSPVHGVGLFADEDIPKGTRIWKMHKLIDRMFTEEELEALPEPAYSTIDRLAYYCDEEDAYIFSTDGAQYMNHSDEPNIRDDVALRDIAKGEELFEDYHYEYDE